MISMSKAFWQHQLIRCQTIRAVYDAKCGRPQRGRWVGQMRTLADRGRGYEMGSFFADVLYGRPLRPTHLLLSGRCYLRDPHISTPGVRVKCGKSTAPTITLQTSAIYNVKCGRPQGKGFGKMRTPSDRRGVKTGIFLRTSFMGEP